MPDNAERRGTIGSVVLGTTAGLVVGGNEKRVALVFSPANAGRYTVSPQPSPAIDLGLTLMTNGGFLELTREKHGDVVTRPWHGVAGQANTKVAFLEVSSK
jgi:hypothetical protein